MTYNELIAELKRKKMEGEILDYLIDSDFDVKGANLYVKARLTIFSDTGKPSVMTALVQGTVGEEDIEELQELALVKAYQQNEPHREQTESY